MLDIRKAETHVGTPQDDGSTPVHDLSVFLLDFASTLLAVGSQPSRVVRSAERIGSSFGFDVDMLIMHKHVIMTIFSREHPEERRTSVRIIRPAAFNFDIILALNTLSWNAHDAHLPLVELRNCYLKVTTAPRYPDRVLLPLVACANAAFCHLFGGDALAVVVVCLATLLAFFLRQKMLRAHMDHRLVFMTVAFAASFMVAVTLPHVPTLTPEVALATSVLFLIPGVPLINAINDIMEGFVLMGIARTVNAGILIICIALGLSATLLIMGVSVA